MLIPIVVTSVFFMMWHICMRHRDTFAKEMLITCTSTIWVSLLTMALIAVTFPTAVTEVVETRLEVKDISYNNGVYNFWYQNEDLVRIPAHDANKALLIESDSVTVPTYVKKVKIERGSKYPSLWPSSLVAVFKTDLESKFLIPKNYHVIIIRVTS